MRDVPIIDINPITSIATIVTSVTSNELIYLINRCIISIVFTPILT